MTKNINVKCVLRNQIHKIAFAARANTQINRKHYRPTSDGASTDTDDSKFYYW